ncbi:MAG: hypothetical protein WCF57_02995 [Pyrinomonadaceae bacterium]
MHTSTIFKRGAALLIALLTCGLMNMVSAQTTGTATQDGAQQQPTVNPTVVVPDDLGPALAIGGTDIYCAGFIQYAPSPNNLQIVGGEQEQERRIFSQGDVVYINAGAQQGVQVDQEFSIVRPRGQFRTKLSKKKGWLGVYTQELGRLRVISVKERISVAVVSNSCETILLGDLLRAAPQRISSTERQEAGIDRFVDPSGKQKGRIVLARDGREMVSRSQVVYIDLGAEDNIKPGDFFTVYRRVGRGTVTNFRDEEIATAADRGFESARFKGGQFSIQAQRVKDANNTGIYGPIISSIDVKNDRPRPPRKIVGELVVLSVQKRTATAVVTRVAQEVHTGDDVELQ